jgi:hypothetical protein
LVKEEENYKTSKERKGKEDIDDDDDVLSTVSNAS